MKNTSIRALAASGCFVALLSAVIAGCASTPAESTPAKAAAVATDDRDCFNGREVSGWNAVDAKTVRVNAGPSKRYDLTLMSRPANQLNFQEVIAVKSGPSDWICTGNGLGVSIVTGGIGPQSYPVTNIVRAPTPAQEREAKEKAKAAEAAGAQAQPN
ncbi:MAG: DUF6491 family protein [Caulobacterales bacterium]